MFTFPQQAAFNRTIAKTRIYDHAQPSKAVRNRFVQEVESIVWSYKLAPETINLPPSSGVHEIQVFTLTAKTPEVSEIVLRTIDEAIPSPLFFRICHGDRVRGRIAYKRPSEAATDAWVVEDGFTGPWHPAATVFPPLPAVLDLGQLYARLLEPYLQPPARPGETLPSHLTRLRELRRLTREADGLAAALAKEKQFNRKVEVNAQLRALKQQQAILLS
jgi:hypothetical protein